MPHRPSRGPTYDYVLVGGGIVGLTVALEIRRRGMGTVAVLEKEPELGRHGSGRNSGVIHAGIYYPAHTLRARVCRDGARRLREYAQERGLPWKKNGKVIVAQSPEQTPQIDILHARATENGVPVEILDPDELGRVEPEAHTFGRALYSPDTAVIDQAPLLQEIASDLSRAGGDLRLGTAARRIDVPKRTIVTDGDFVGYGTLINTAGLHADHVARWFGVGRAYQILPFKGLYRGLTPEAGARFRGNIYPAPDLRMPFLGVHITPEATGRVLVGPTAIPALGRENYGWLQGVEGTEAARMVAALGLMLTHDRQGMQSLVRAELGRYSSAGFLREARGLAPGLRAGDIGGVCKVGLRSQLVDRRTKDLVKDYVVERAEHSLHVLNAISPAFTSAFALADVIVDGL